MLQRDIKVLIKVYFKKEAYFDIAANLPVLIFNIMIGFPTELDDIEKL